MEEIAKVVEQLLPISTKSLLQDILKRLEEKGVEEPNDLKYINVEEDLKGILKEVPARKFKKEIDVFFNGQPSTNNEEAAMGVSECTVGLTWAEKYSIPLQMLPKMMLNRLQKNIRLSPSDYREFIRILVASILEIQPKPLKQHLAIIARKVIDIFPIMTEMIDGKPVGTGCDGMLRKLICRVENLARATAQTKERKILEKQTSKRSYGCLNFYPTQTPENIEENEGKRIDLQVHFQLSSWELGNVDPLMEDTFPLQRQHVVEAKSIEGLKKEWPFLFISRYAFVHFRQLMGMDVVAEMDKVMSTKMPELCSYLASIGSDADPERYLETLASCFSEDKTSIIRIFENSSVKDVAGRLDTSASPYIAAFGDPYTMEPVCMIFIDRQEASEFLPLKEASSLWFASFFIFGLEYPEECPATAEFIQRAFLGINPEKGSKGKKRTKYTVNAKVTKLVDKLCNFKSIWS